MGEVILEKLLDEDLNSIAYHFTINSMETILLIQILRELRKEGPEEKRPAVRGFAA